MPSFDVQIKRGGQFFTIGKNIPFGKALKLGSERVKSTLAATFRLRPSGLTTIKDIPFKLSGKEFRTYSYRRSKKRYEPFTYIQRTTPEGGVKGGRLSSSGELAEIRSAWNNLKPKKL